MFLKVTSLASTSDAPLGELAGKSYAQVMVSLSSLLLLVTVLL